MAYPLHLFIASGLALISTTHAQTFDWATAYAKANASLAQLTLQDKVDIVTGVGWNNGPCVGNTAAISSIGYPELCLQDSPLGIRFGSSVTAFTPGIQAASTWDIDLMRQRGEYLGAEAKGCGVHVLLGPVAGPLGKNAQGGRNWEGFGPDPYLTGIAMAETIAGMQGSGVQATAKHFILNEQETDRTTVSSNVDDRTMHELYLWPFADAVYAGVASVMCSYNKVNGSWACENEGTMMGLLKEELGFPGYVMSDWDAQHTTVQSANSGLDMTMPGSDYNGGTILWGPQLTSAIDAGNVSIDRVDDMVTRILAAWYLVGQDGGYPATNIQANVQGNHKDNVRAVARDGIVLLKNTGSILPLKKPGKLALVGSAAIVNPDGANACEDRSCDTGTLGMGWGSGTTNYPYLVSPYDALENKTSADGTVLSLSASDNTSNVASAVSGADVAIVVITSDSGEGYLVVEDNAGDRNNLDPWHSGNQLVQAVAAANNNTIVVVQSVGPVILESILALEGVKAIVWAGLAGQESGNALVDILYGSTSPSGKLPYTIAKSASDYGTGISTDEVDNFPEGLYIDYRHFDEANITPRYEFGFGLCKFSFIFPGTFPYRCLMLTSSNSFSPAYSNFTYSNAQVTSTATSGPASGSVAPGGRSDLFEQVATVKATITNTGSVAAAEVAQLYISLPQGAPAAPPRQLRGFIKVSLEAGASNTITFGLRRRDLSHWDVATQNWNVPAGSFNVSVGASSRDLRLSTSLVVP